MECGVISSWIKKKLKLALNICTFSENVMSINIIVLLRDVFHIGLVISPRPAVLA
jgi:hypothetical protein